MHPDILLKECRSNNPNCADYQGYRRYGNIEFVLRGDVFLLSDVREHYFGGQVLHEEGLNEHQKEHRRELPWLAVI
jgi:hypothetical protein